MQTLELSKMELQEISPEELKTIDGGWEIGDGICPDWWRWPIPPPKLDPKVVFNPVVLYGF